MSKIEKELNCNFDELLHHIENGILNGSLSATLEDSSDFIQKMEDVAFAYLKDTVHLEIIA